MAREEPMVNGSRPRRSGGALAQEFQETVLPQATALLADAESVLRKEAKLLEARVLFRFAKLEARLIVSMFGVGALLAAFGLFIATVIYGLQAMYPELAIWAITGILAIVVGSLGGFLISGRAYSRNFRSGAE